MSQAESILDPDDLICLQADHIETARWLAAREIVAAKRRQKISGGLDQAGLLGPVYTGGGSAKTLIQALADFDENQDTAQVGDYIDLACPAVQITRQNMRALGFQIGAGPSLGVLTLPLTGRAPCQQQRCPAGLSGSAGCGPEGLPPLPAGGLLGVLSPTVGIAGHGWDT